MKKYKKLFVVVLSLMMVFTMMPASVGMAFADDTVSEGLVDVEGTTDGQTEDLGDALTDGSDQPADDGDVGTAETPEPTDTPADVQPEETGTDQPADGGDVGTAETPEPTDTPADVQPDEPDADKPEDSAAVQEKTPEEQPTDVEEPADNTPAEETQDEELPETGASYTSKDDAEALIVHGKAAESEKEARLALEEEGLSKKEAKRLAEKLFGDAKKPEDVTKDADGKDEGSKVSADGTTIGGIHVEWYVDDEPYKDSLLTVTPPNDAAQMVKARVWFELSGENNYAPGTIRITIPAHNIFYL